MKNEGPQNIKRRPDENKTFSLDINYYENSKQGFIKLYRSIKNHWLWNDQQKTVWWIDILLTVNHAPANVVIQYETFLCGPGQTLRSFRQWAKQWRVDVSTVRRFFALLKKHGMIKIENLKKTTRLTVSNWSSYNGIEHATQTRRKRHATQTIMNKKKNNKEEEEAAATAPPGLTIEEIKKVANEVFKNTGYVESIAMQQSLKIPDVIKWAAGFNAVLTGDVIDGFNDRIYRKMFSGWLNKQRAKGYELPVADEIKKTPPGPLKYLN